jgi:hypothetical protein
VLVADREHALDLAVASGEDARYLATAAFARVTNELVAERARESQPIRAD